MALSEQKLKELDKTLLELALSSFDHFCLVAGVDKTQAFVCIEKAKGKSLGEIAVKLKISRQAVHQRCHKCPKN